MPRVSLSGSGGIAGSSGVGVSIAASYGLTHATDDSMATVNTTALQDAIDDMTDWRTSRLCGATLVIPAGRYVFNGGISFPSVNGFPITVIATGARFRYPNTGTVGENTAMFSTPMPTDSTDAETQNDLRDRWRWIGGDFDCRSKTGSSVFEWNAVSRMTMRDVSIANCTEGIRNRFTLHFRLQDSMFYACSDYGFRGESESGDWGGWTQANSAGHAIIIENCRFYQAAGAQAGVRVTHTEFTVRDCTFEGNNPVTNIDFVNANNSCLSSSVSNLHLENTPTDSHIRLNTSSGFVVDINHAVAGVRVNAVAAASVDVYRHGCSSTGFDYVGNALFKTASTTATRWRFWQGGSGHGGFGALDATAWVDGVVPTKVAGPALFGGSNNDGNSPGYYMGSRRVALDSSDRLVLQDAAQSNTIVGTQS